jgi:hypothetical protein
MQTGPPLPPSEPQAQPPKPPEPEITTEPEASHSQQSQNFYGYSGNLSYTQTAVISQPPLPVQNNPPPPPPDEGKNFQQNQPQFNQNQNSSFGQNSNRNNFGGNQRGNGRDNRDNRDNRGGRGRDNNSFNNRNNDNQNDRRGGGNRNQRGGGRNNWNNNRNDERDQRWNQNQNQNQRQNRNNWNDDRNSNQNFHNNQSNSNFYQNQNQQNQQQQQPQRNQQPQPQPQKSQENAPLSIANIPKEALEEKNAEEIAFDEQFRKWEEEFDNWKKANANHPDKNAYNEYEQRFEDCRRKLLERREQMKKKKIEQLQAQYGTHSIPQQSQSQEASENKADSFIGPQIPANVDLSHSRDDFTEDMDFSNEEYLPQDSLKKSFYEEDSTTALEGWLSKSSAGIPGLDLVNDGQPKHNVQEAAEVINVEEEPVQKRPAKRTSKWDNPDKPKVLKQEIIVAPLKTHDPYSAIQLAQPPPQQAIPPLMGIQLPVQETSTNLNQGIAQIMQNKDLMALLAASLNTAHTGTGAPSVSNIENVPEKVENYPNQFEKNANEQGHQSNWNDKNSRNSFSGNFGRSNSNSGNNFASQGNASQEPQKPKIKSLLDIDPFDVPDLGNNSNFESFNAPSDRDRENMSGIDETGDMSSSVHDIDEYSQSQSDYQSQQNQPFSDYFVPAHVQDHDHRPVPSYLYEEDRYFTPAKVIDYNHKPSGMFPVEEVPKHQESIMPQKPNYQQHPQHPPHINPGAQNKKRKKKRFDYLQVR